MSLNAFSPLVSVVIPVYNGSNFLAQAIDSALAQTYKNIEIIVVNDGSNDDGKTRKIALSYGARIRYFEKENGGAATALNLGIEKMRGEYLAWLSHDDEFLPNKLMEQVKLLENMEDRDNTILFADYTIHNLLVGGKWDAKNLDPCLMESGSLYRWLLAIFSSKLHGCTSLMPKKCFDCHGRFDADKRTTQDYHLFCKMLRSGVRFVYQDKSNIITRHHEMQDTLKIMDVHQREVGQFFIDVIDQFADELSSYDFVFVEQFLKILKDRNQTDAYIHLFNVWCEKRADKDAPPLWLYWECAPGTSIPDYIYLCWKSMAVHCQRDFRVTILTPSNLKRYLPNIDPCYRSLAKIAHRADFIRFNLLYEYGGVWLDSDFIVFRSLRQVMSDIEYSGFAAMGYYKNGGKEFFPMIAFLAAKKHNQIVKNVLDIMKKMIHNIVDYQRRQPEWDEIGGYLLQEVMLKAKNGFVFYEVMEYFSFFPLWYQHISYLGYSDISSFYKTIHPKMFGQILTNSRDMDTLAQFTEEQMLRENTLISNLFKISFSGVRYYPPSIQSIASTLAAAACVPRNFLMTLSGWKAGVKAKLRKVPLIRAIYYKFYKPARLLAGKLVRGAVSHSAWRRQLGRLKAIVWKYLSPFRKADSMRGRFTYIYKRNLWKCSESRSGNGSSFEATKVIRRHLPTLFEKYHVRVFLDLPCGDYNWMKSVNLDGIQYIGGDIVDEIVESNRAMHARKGVHFLPLNLIEDKLPQADMILCRDCLVHFNFDDIDTALKNLHQSGIKYILTTTFPDRMSNRDINTGEFRPINLQIEPFNFPEPLLLVNEECIEEDRHFTDKSLGLWLIADLPKSLSLACCKAA